MSRLLPLFCSTVLLCSATLAHAAFPAKVAKDHASCLAKGGEEVACKRAAFDDYVKRCMKLQPSLLTCETMARASYAVDEVWTAEAFDAAVAAMGAESYRIEGETSGMVDLAVEGGQCLTLRLDSPGPDGLHGQVYGEGLWLAAMSGHRLEVSGPDEPVEVCFDRSGTATLSVSAIHGEHRTVLTGRALQVAVGVERASESAEAAAARAAGQQESVERQLAERAARAEAARKAAIAEEKSSYGFLVALACEICRDGRDACEASGGTGCRSDFEACGASVGLDTFGQRVCLDGR